MKFLVILSCVLMLAGCSAMPWGKPKENDFITKRVTANIPANDAYANLQQGFRYCSQKYGVPQCKAPDKNGVITCEIYADSSATGKKDQVLGRIQVIPSAKAETRAVLQIRGTIPGNEDTLTAWEIFMSGRVREACP